MGIILLLPYIQTVLYGNVKRVVLGYSECAVPILDMGESAVYTPASK